MHDYNDTFAEPDVDEPNEPPVAGDPEVLDETEGDQPADQSLAPPEQKDGTTSPLVDAAGQIEGSESYMAGDTDLADGDHDKTKAIDPTVVTNVNDVSDPTFTTENQTNTSPPPVVVGAGGQHEASESVALEDVNAEASQQLDADGTVAAPAGDTTATGDDTEGSESEGVLVSQSEGEKVHKEEGEQLLDEGGNPVHPPEVAEAGLAEHRPGVRGRPGIDD